MKNPIIIFIISTLILSSCGSSTSVNTVEAPKTPFYIDTFRVGEKQANISIQKTGRITASSSLTLTAQ
jgi:hypothetical protein